MALAAMERRVAEIRDGAARPKLVWQLEHPGVLTGGSFGARRRPARSGSDLPVHRVGARRAVDLARARPADRLRNARPHAARTVRVAARDVRAFVHGLEDWLIAALARFDVQRRAPRADRVGIWVVDPRHGGREQDRGDRGAGDALGELARSGTERGSGPRGNTAGSCRAGSRHHGVTSLATPWGSAATMPRWSIEALRRGVAREVFEGQGSDLDPPSDRGSREHSSKLKNGVLGADCP